MAGAGRVSIPTNIGSLLTPLRCDSISLPQFASAGPFAWSDLTHVLRKAFSATSPFRQRDEPSRNATCCPTVFDNRPLGFYRGCGQNGRRWRVDPGWVIGESNNRSDLPPAVSPPRPAAERASLVIRRAAPADPTQIRDAACARRSLAPQRTGRGSPGPPPDIPTPDIWRPPKGWRPTMAPVIPRLMYRSPTRKDPSALRRWLGLREKTPPVSA